MTVLKKSSTILTVALLTLLVLLVSNCFYTMYLTHTIKTDAEIINKLGVIRGSIQRLTKLELNGTQDDQLISNVNSIISEFETRSIKLYEENDEIYSYLGQLDITWTSLYEAIYNYRSEPTPSNFQVLNELSEQAWIESNNLVYMSQLSSQGKVAKYSNSYGFLAINIFLGLLIIYLIKKYVKDTLERLVNYDELTQVYNRRYFNAFLLSEIEISKRHGRNLSLIILDIDRFKNINDVYGHDIGDVVLRELAQLVYSSIRKSDVLARIGGEEFAIIMSDSDIHAALTLSEKVRIIVAEHNFTHVGNITISLGSTQFHSNDSPDMLFKRADTALYKAKNNGRNRSEVEILQLVKENS